MWATLPEGVSAMGMFPKALEKKVVYVPGDPFYVGVQDANTMRLNYTNADAAKTNKGKKEKVETKIASKKGVIISSVVAGSAVAIGIAVTLLLINPNLFKKVIKKIFYMSNIFTLVHYDKSSAAA